MSSETAAAPAPRKTRSSKKVPPRPRVAPPERARGEGVPTGTRERKPSLAERLAEAAEGGLEDLAAEQDRQNDAQILGVVSRSSQPLTTDQIASRVGLARYYVAGRLEGLKEARKVTPIRDKWSAGAPLSERKPQGSILFGNRKTPREAVEDLIRDKRMSWSELTSALPQLQPHQVRHGLDLIGRDGWLSSTSKGYTLRKRKGKPSTPIGVSPQPSLLEWRTSA